MITAMRHSRQARSAELPAGPAAGRSTAAVPVLAFTLLELLMVISVIGILAAVAIPSLKNMRRSDLMASANRQLLDDVASARQNAIAGRTTVFMVFAPPAVFNPGSLTGPAWTNLVAGQQTAYRLFAKRTVGDQPGEENWNRRYLTSWRHLPNGVFIPTWKFNNVLAVKVGPLDVRPFKTDDFYLNSTVTLNLPCIEFNAEGRLNSGGLDEVIPLARGSIFYDRDSSGGLVWGPADVTENPPGNSTNNYNCVVIDWLTGRAKLVRPEIPIP
jgi:prepilin-type N-terminal cleavage/methylation domain-containing protein